MKKFYSLLIGAIIMLAIPMGMKGQNTKTEGFETATASSTYNSTVTVNSNQSDCGIGWSFYYGTVSTQGPIAGSKSAQMRWYKSALSNYPTLTSTTPIEGLTNVAFKARVGHVDVKMDVKYSSDGTNWTALATAVTFADTYAADFSYDIPSGGKYIQFGVSSSSTAPNGTFYSLLVDNVVFTYSSSVNTYTVTYHANVIGTTDIEVEYNEGDDVTVAANTFTNPGYAFTEWNTEADGSGDIYAPGDEIEDIDDDLDLYAQWEESNEMTLVFPLTSNPGGWPTSQSTSLEEYTYTLSGVDYVFTLKNAKCSSGYLMVYQPGVVGLPAIEGYKLTKVVASNSSGCSTAVQVGISSSASQASYIAGGAAQTWSTTSSQYTYNLTSTEINTMYYLYVTNKNAQVTGLTLTYEAATAPSVATPTFNYDDGTTFGNEGLSVEISCETNNASIYYTLDGSTPDNSSTLYEGAFTLTTTTTVKAIAYDGTNYSNVATAIYTYVDPNAPGTENNPYTVAQARAAIDANAGTQGVYATGIVSEIKQAWNSQYNNITFNFVDNEGDNNFLQAYRCVSGDADASDVAVGDIVVVYGNLTKYSSTYEFGQGCQLVSLTHPAVDVEAPTFSPVAGTYAEAQSVTISCATTGADIYYTLDGTEPDANSTPYSGTISVTTTTTIKAIAYNAGANSTVTTATYHICSAENPYTVAEVVLFNEYPSSQVYVHGIVSTAPSSLSNGTLTYYISDDGTTNNQIEVYKGKDLDNESFTSADDIQVGDIVTVYGSVQIYNSTFELGSGNYLVSFERPAQEYTLTVTCSENVEIFTFVGDSTDPGVEGATTQQVTNGTEVGISVSATTGYILTLTVDGSDVTSQLDETGYYTFYMPTHDVTVSATAVENVAPAGGNYVRITDLAQLTDGSKVIIAARYDEDHTNGYYAMPGQTSGKPVGVAFTSETSGNGEILPATITASEDTYYWTVNVTNDSYTFTNAENQMIGYTSSTNFATGNNTAWTIARETAGNNAMVAEYTGFVIRNGNTNTRAFAFNGTAFGAYATTNMNAAGYNFYLDFFVQTEAVEPETYTKHIIGYNSEQGNGSGNFYLIASPIGDVAPTNVTNMIKTDNNGEGYDLYRFNQNPVETEIDGVSTKLEWENYKQEGDHYHFNLESGKGYLYANSETVDLIFTGTAYSGTGEVSLTNNGDNDLSGWNLVGNPFTVKTYITGDYNVMNADGNEIIAATEDQDREENSVNPMEGIFVYTTEASTLQFSTTAPSKLSKRLALNLSRGRGVMDRAIVRFDDSQPMPKFQLKDNSTKVYIPMDGKDYAVVNAQEQGEMPVNFKAKENGTYTLSINTKDVNFGYLHLIDNMTGDDIDLNVTPSYTFNAKADDYESRFKLVYAADNTDDNNFAFISNGEIIFNGQGTVQIYDVNGRMISSYNDVTSISTSDMANGVYMLRLINGNNVKTQKIVVK